MRDFLQGFFAANRIIVLSIYGQVFFVLGLAIALQSWRHSRLALARTLKWLALFGFTHALHEWGYVFIPLQAQYMPPPFIDVMTGLQLLLLALSFACLLQFGIELLRPLPSRWRGLRYSAWMLLGLWIWWAWGPALLTAAQPAQWHDMAAIWARLLIGFPAALLAAFGLYRQARDLAVSFPTQSVERNLRLASLALAGYAIMGGLVVPEAAFFPADFLNDGVVERLSLVPVPVYRSLFGLLLTFAIIRSLEVFRIELDRRLLTMEETQLRLAERARIGRELHDGTLQKIYAAGLLLRASERDTEWLPADRRLDRIRQSGDLLNDAVADIRAYIGALHDPVDSRSLAAGLQEITQARHLRSLVEVELKLEFDEQRAIAPRAIGHLLAITQEALSNVARHAQATRVCVAASGDPQGIHLEVADNGRGLPADYVLGYGLRNMHERARLLDGTLIVHSRPGKGTTIRLEIPWREGHDSAPVVAG